MTTSVGIAGAGLAGSLMASMLAHDGHDVTVYERRPDPRPDPLEGGRSINLALSHRGIRALDGIGITETVLAQAVPMQGRLMHGLGGDLTFQPYGTSSEQVIHSVSRSGLNNLLLDAAEQAGARFNFEHRIRDVDIEAAHLTTTVPEGGQAVREHDFVIGADGAFSAIRARMQKGSGFDFQQSYLEHGYKELSMPPTAGGGHAMEPNALHIWPRGNYMMIALPNADGSYTCTLFWPLKGAVSFEAIETGSQIEDLFRRDFSDVLPLIPDLVEQYTHNPVGSLVTIRCGPWNHGNRAVLIGDAAHAVVPFYGQGMNASFEDCRLLRDELRTAPSRAVALERFSSQRRVDADALAELAVDNYITMRDRVSSRFFLLGRTVGRVAHTLLPSVFVPLYTLVTFTSVPYAAAAERWARQVRLARVVGVVLLMVVVVGIAISIL